MKPTLHVSRTGPGFDKIRHGLTLIGGQRVLVGIPQDTSGRRPEGLQGPLRNTGHFTASGISVTNAELMYIHSKGSKLRNIPARPVIEPAIMADDNRRRIVAQLVLAARADMDGQHEEALEYLNKAGLTAANAAKRWFTDPRNGWHANKRATILRKLRKLRGQAMREYLKARKDGSDLTEFDTPLIDTGQLRRAITYIVETMNRIMEAEPEKIDVPSALPEEELA